MSHYKIAVIVDGHDEYEVDDILAPYSENLEVEPYIDMTREEFIEYVQNINKDFKDWEGLTHEERYQKYIETYDIMVDEDGNKLTTYNPNSKWDWYSIYNDESFAEFKKRLFKPLTRAEIKRCRKVWDWLNSDQEDSDDEDIIDYMFFKKEYYLDSYKDFETFLRCEHFFASDMPYALVDRNGWYALGNVGWFAVDDATADSINDYINFIYNYVHTPSNKDKRVVWVDCHI